MGQSGSRGVRLARSTPCTVLATFDESNFLYINLKFCGYLNIYTFFFFLFCDCVVFYYSYSNLCYFFFMYHGY